MTAPEPFATSESQTLAALSDGRWHDSRELEKFGRRFAARLHDAQKAGRIAYECRKKAGTGRFEYRLTPKPSEQPTPPTISHASDSSGFTMLRVVPVVQCPKCKRWRKEGLGPHSPHHGPDGRQVDCVGREIAR